MNAQDIEAVYPLSPTQEGILFHTLYASGSAVYLEQFSFRLRGALDEPAFERAWQRSVDRHPILRTLFRWERQKRPLQVVRRRFTLEWQKEDWRGRSPEEQGTALESFLEADRDKGFNLSTKPAMRVALLRLADDVTQFVWSFHHILLDGWSVAVLLGEVFDSYRAFRSGVEPQQAATRPYRDYIAWLGQRNLNAAEGFWRRYLQEFRAATPLRLGKPSTSPREPRHREQRAYVAPATAAALQSLARQHQLTLNTICQVAWGLILSRYSGDTDVVFGAAVSGRPPELAGIESMVGLFINTLPVRMDASGERPFLACAKEIQAAQVEFRDYEHTPLVQIQEWSETPRGGSLFESLLVFENYPTAHGRQESVGVAVEEYRLNAHTNYPLHLRVAPIQGLQLELTYDRGRFDDAACTFLLDQFKGLLEQIAAAPNRALRTYSLASASQPLPDPQLPISEVPFTPVTALIESWAARCPEQVALSRAGDHVTYGQLVERARRIAQALRTRGVKPGDVVAVGASPGLGTIVSMLGVLLSRGVLLTLDDRLPAERRQAMLEASRARDLVRVGPRAAADEWIESTRLRSVIAVDTEGRVIDPPPAPDRPDSGIAGDDPAYVFFTSGTTGGLKGVLGCHKGLSHFVEWQRTTFRVGRTDRCSHLTSLSFDVVLREVFLPLTSGAVLCLPAEAGDLGAAHVLPFLERERISILHTVPTVAENWLADTHPAAALQSLRYVFFAGEPLTSGIVRRWREAFPGTGEIINLYGPTETTLAKCWFRVPAGELDDVQPVGQPLPQTQALVLTQAMQLCGVGERGEIVVRTPYRTLGYINAPDEQAARFMTNPFTGGDGDLVYRTGDLGRYRPDGLLEILGRTDHQVKIRGARVELGEIEGRIAAHPAVRQVAVLYREDETGEKRLVAYLALSGDGPAPASLDLRTFLRRTLPDYMVPSAFVFMDALPMTSNGKLDRRALPAPERSPVEAADGFVAARGPVEETMARIWEEVLSVDRVGVQTDFFELGGHSLTATRVISRIRDAFGVEIPLRTLFESPRIDLLATYIEAALGPAYAVAAPGTAACAREEGEV